MSWWQITTTTITPWAGMHDRVTTRGGLCPGLLILLTFATSSFLQCTVQWHFIVTMHEARMAVQLRQAVMHRTVCCDQALPF
jgi:hypothetical protein